MRTLPAILLALLLAACGSSSTPTTSTAPPPDPTAVATTAPATEPVTASTTDTASAPPTTTAAIADGRSYALIRGIAVDDLTLRIDPAAFLTGDEANAACVAEHAPECPPPNDYYVSNPDESTIDVPFSPEVAITVVDWANCCATKAGSLAGLADAIATGASTAEYQWADNGFWVTVVDGEITAIEEQYRP